MTTCLFQRLTFASDKQLLEEHVDFAALHSSMHEVSCLFRSSGMLPAQQPHMQPWLHAGNTSAVLLCMLPTSPVQQVESTTPNPFTR